MFHKLLDHNLAFPKIIFKKFSQVKLNFDLGHEMKSLNDKKQFQKAIELFDKHNNTNTETMSSFVIVQALKACTYSKDLRRGSIIHDRIISTMKPNSYVKASLINMLVHCGDLTKAQLLFDSEKDKTLSMYAIMMKAYVKQNQAQQAIDLFREIKQPDDVNVILLFNACAQLRTAEALNLVKQTIQQIPKAFFSNFRLLTSCLDALMKCGDIENAESLFYASKEKVLSMYGAMMKGYIDNDLAPKVIDLFQKIKDPNNKNTNLIFYAGTEAKACENSRLPQHLPNQVPECLFSDPYVFTSLLHALMKCGNVEYAEALFRTSSEKTLPSYGAMMKGYLLNDLPQKAFNLFQKIKNPNDVHMIILFNACAQLNTHKALEMVRALSVKISRYAHTNPHVLTSLLDALIKCGDLKYAESLFLSSNKKSLSSYATMISGFIKDNNPSKALQFFNQIAMNGIEINSGLYLCIIKAVTQIGDYSLAQSIVKQIPPSMLVEKQIQTALIDLWGKVGSVNEAKNIFDRIHQPNEFGYVAMVNAYGLNGMGVKAVQLFRQMPKEYLNEAAYVCVLNACSHSGLIDEARTIFESISDKTAAIYCTMVDCLSRASYFLDAQALIDECERTYPPQPAMYMALLSGARNANDISLSQNIYDRMKKHSLEMEDAIVSGAVLLANTYKSVGETDRASEIRQDLHKSGMKKQVGVSQTVVDGQIYIFKAHDRSHPRSDEIYAEVKKISHELLKHGHQYDESWITRPLNQDETVESVLCGHSERLAIAWNFVVNPNASRIQLSKNLRVCGDCHRSTKLIAAIRQCEIIVRDANRIHHFNKNGQCSCNDYF